MSAVGLGFYAMHYPPLPFTRRILHLVSEILGKWLTRLPRPNGNREGFYGYLTTSPQPPREFRMEGVMTLPYPYGLLYSRFACRWSTFTPLLTCLGLVLI